MMALSHLPTLVFDEVQRLRTHPGVGPITALAFVLVIGTPWRFQCGKQGKDSGRREGGLTPFVISSGSDWCQDVD